MNAVQAAYQAYCQKVASRPGIEAMEAAIEAWLAAVGATNSSDLQRIIIAHNNRREYVREAVRRHRARKREARGHGADG